MARLNPRRKPATEADVRRARDEAVKEASRLASAIFLTVLCDKFGGQDWIPEIWGEVNKLSQEIVEHRVSLPDLVRVLREEYEIEI